MSALRINLLPASIAERRQTQQALVACVALSALLVGASLAYAASQQVKAKAAETEADAMETQATGKAKEVSDIKAEASKLRAQIQPISDRVDFVKQVKFYNTWVQKIYRRAALYTDSRVEYSSMAVNGGTLAMTGYVQSVDDLARYLITFYGNPDVTAVSVSGPPGWQRPSQVSINPLQQSATAPKGFSFSVNATLYKALQRPALPTSLGGDPVATEAPPKGAPTATTTTGGSGKKGAGPTTPPTAPSVTASPGGPNDGGQ